LALKGQLPNAVSRAAPLRWTPLSKDRLATLERAADHLRADRPAALEAIRKSILFLDSSGVLHTMDEEESMFPRLRPHLTPEELHYLDGLEEQHRAAESVFTELKDVAEELAVAADNSMSLESRYRELAARLSALYRPHIQSEDEILIRLARRTLTADQLKAITKEMKGRRERLTHPPTLAASDAGASDAAGVSAGHDEKEHFESGLFRHPRSDQ
jgi:hemerythrin-like domain-containing protein